MLFFRRYSTNCSSLIYFVNFYPYFNSILSIWLYQYVKQLDPQTIQWHSSDIEFEMYSSRVYRCFRNNAVKWFLQRIVTATGECVRYKETPKEQYTPNRCAHRLQSKVIFSKYNRRQFRLGFAERKAFPISFYKNNYNLTTTYIRCSLWVSFLVALTSYHSISTPSRLDNSIHVFRTTSIILTIVTLWRMWLMILFVWLGRHCQVSALICAMPHSAV